MVASRRNTTKKKVDGYKGERTRITKLGDMIREKRQSCYRGKTAGMFMLRKAASKEGGWEKTTLAKPPQRKHSPFDSFDSKPSSPALLYWVMRGK